MDGRPRLVVVDVPGDPKKRRLIDRLARYVASEGHPFEQVIMERESPEGPFSFLTFAFAQRDNFKVWRTQTFRLCEGGRWLSTRCGPERSASVGQETVEKVLVSHTSQKTGAKTITITITIVITSISIATITIITILAVAITMPSIFILCGSVRI
eukprot:s4416_g6.t1